jgi:hypothetical protein
MIFRRLCEHCGDLVVCARDADTSLTCSRCGGMLVGPFALPTPVSYRDRVEVLLSRHYLGAVAGDAEQAGSAARPHQP